MKRWFVPALVLCVLAQPALATPRTDDLQSQQWGLAQIHAAPAWKVTEGRGVTVAVIDSGVDAAHPDFQGRVLHGVDLLDPHGNADTDKDGHGTGIASIIAAGRHNGGMVGVAPQSRILPIRIIDGSSANLNVMPEAIDLAVARGAAVISISIGLIAPVEPANEAAGLMDDVQAAIDRALARGVVTIAGAGNNGAPWCSDPAALRHVVCVGGVDENRQHDWYSHFDVAQRATLVVAPVAANLPLHPGTLVAVPGGGYGNQAGTSFATPFVSGIAALLAARGLHGQQLIDRLLSTCSDLGPAGRDAVFGYGEVDAAAALRVG
jgi:subtilisin family serine protease